MATAEKSEHAPEGDAGRPVAGSRLAGFDCLRAVAALSILTYHAVLFTPAFAGTIFWKVLLQLRSGVWVFFGVLHVWSVGSSTYGFDQRVRFSLGLVGITASHD